MVDEEDVAKLQRLRQATETRRSASVAHPRARERRAEGGVEARCQRLARELERRGEEVTEALVVPTITDLLTPPAAGPAASPPAGESGASTPRSSLRLAGRARSMVIGADVELDDTPVVRARARRHHGQQPEPAQDAPQDLAKLIELQRKGASETPVGGGSLATTSPRRSSEPAGSGRESLLVSSHGLVGDDDLALLASLMALRSQTGNRASDDLGVLKGLMSHARQSVAAGALVGQDDLALLDELMAMRTKRASLGAADAGILRDLDALRSSRGADEGADDNLAVLRELMALRSEHSAAHGGLVGDNDLALLDELMALRSSSPGFSHSTGADVAMLAGLMSASRDAGLSSGRPVVSIASEPASRATKAATGRRAGRKTSRFDPDAFVESFD